MLRPIHLPGSLSMHYPEIVAALSRVVSFRLVESLAEIHGWKQHTLSCVEHSAAMVLRPNPSSGILLRRD